MTTAKKTAGRPPAAKKTAAVKPVEKAEEIVPEVVVPEVQYVALKDLTAGDNFYKAGEIVPEANSWLRLESWIMARWIKEVKNAEVISDTEL
jgi:hypothetical protein